MTGIEEAEEPRLLYVVLMFVVASARSSCKSGVPNASLREKRDFNKLFCKIIRT